MAGYDRARINMKSSLYDSSFAEDLEKHKKRKGKLSAGQKMKPKDLPVNRFVVSLPDEYVTALNGMFPSLSTQAAIRRYIIMTVKV